MKSTYFSQFTVYFNTCTEELHGKGRTQKVCKFSRCFVKKISSTTRPEGPDKYHVDRVHDLKRDCKN